MKQDMVKYILLIYFLGVTLGLGAQNPVRVSDLNSNPSVSGGNSFVREFIDYQGKICFRGDDRSGGTSNAEFWISDGTLSGNQLFELNPNGPSNPRNFIEYNGKLYFQANNGSDGVELFEFDGTAATMVQDINPGVLDSNPEQFIIFNNILYFVADNGNTGASLFKFDGTSISSVANIDGTADDDVIREITIFNNALFFEASNGEDGNQLFTMDAQENVSQFAIINPITFTASIDDFFEWDGNLYFEANDGVNGAELWVTDGVNPPSLVDDINSNGFSELGSFAIFQDKLYFRATDEVLGNELFVYDGVNPPSLAADINVGGEPSDVSALIVFNDRLYFAAVTTAEGREIWSFDGTNPPALLKDINSDPNDSLLEGLEFTLIGDKIYFAADDGNGLELWESDGSSENTVRVGENRINASATASVSSLFYSSELRSLFFAATDGTNGLEAWKYPIGPQLRVLQGETVLSNGSTYNFLDTDFEESTQVEFTLSNIGILDLEISDISLNGDAFSVIGDIPSVVAAGQTASFTIELSSASVGAASGSFTVESNDLAGPNYTVDLSALITSVEDQLSLDIQTYPNPTLEKIALRFGQVLNKNTQLRLLNSQGQIVQVQDLAPNTLSTELDLAKLPRGIYYLEILSSSGKKVQKLIKQ